MSQSCPSCQALVKSNEDACNLCGWQFEKQPRKTKVVTKAAARPKMPITVEMNFDADRTGSSDQFSNGILEAVRMILNSLEESTQSVVCRVQTHGDQDEGQMPILLVENAGFDETIEAIKSITFEGGGDPPEHHLDAIEHLVNTTPWSMEPGKVRGAIVSFLTADSKPATTGSTATQIGQRIKDQGVLLYLVCQPTKTLQELVEAADGLMFEISNSPKLEEMQKIAGQLAASIVSTVGSGSTSPVIANSFKGGTQ